MGTPFTRDMDTLGSDGPQATQFETATARTDTSGTAPVNGQQQAEAQRPQFSPVAQPGMDSVIHYHEVRTPPEPPSQPAKAGVLTRFTGSSPDVTTVVQEGGPGGRRRRKHKHKRGKRG